LFGKAQQLHYIFRRRVSVDSQRTVPANTPANFAPGRLLTTGGIFFESMKIRYIYPCVFLFCSCEKEARGLAQGLGKTVGAFVDEAAKPAQKNAQDAMDKLRAEQRQRENDAQIQQLQDRLRREARMR
jgi:hypothetical protein